MGKGDQLCQLDFLWGMLCAQQLFVSHQDTGSHEESCCKAMLQLRHAVPSDASSHLIRLLRSTQQLIHEVIEPHPGPGPSPVNSEGEIGTAIDTTDRKAALALGAGLSVLMTSQVH